MKKIIVIFFAVFIISGSLSPFWDYSRFYKSTSYKSFQNLRQILKPVNIYRPNEELLSAALFFFTNKVRIANNLNPFKYSRSLQLASYSHIKGIIRLRYKRTNTKRTLLERVRYFTRTGYSVLFENIATHTLLNAPVGTYVNPPERRGGYYYRDSGDKITALSYKSVALKIIGLWLENPTAKKVILHPKLKVLGVSAVVYYHPGHAKIPMIMAAQIAADGMSDQMYTGDIEFIKNKPKAD
jgi:uncharacterized protein YkwD